jgi:hypothetical protein
MYQLFKPFPLSSIVSSGLFVMVSLLARAMSPRFRLVYCLNWSHRRSGLSH